MPRRQFGAATVGLPGAIILERMDAPPVRYVTAEDGYRIAFTASGEGPPLVCLPFSFSHAQLSWQSPATGPLLNRLAQRFRLIHYDGRGQGLSQRGLSSETCIEHLQLDLKAVIENLNLRRPILFGDQIGVNIAVQYALEHPEQVAALLLIRAFARRTELDRHQLEVAKTDWDWYLRGMVQDNVPIELRQANIERFKASITRDDYVELMRILNASELTEDLGKLTVPALVIHPRNSPWVDEETSTRVASLIPNARLVTISDGFLVWGNPDEATDAIDGFLASIEEAPGVSGPRGASQPDDLSMRELEVLRLLAAGKSNQQIADELVISLNTVRRHVSNVFDKTGVANRAQAGAWAREHGLT